MLPKYVPWSRYASLIGRTGFKKPSGKPLIFLPLVVTAFLFVIACSATEADLTSTEPTPTSIPTNLRIANAGEELNFAAPDLPVGWQVTSTEASGQEHNMKAIKMGDVVRLPERMVDSSVVVASSSRGASKRFDERKAEFSNTAPVTQLGIANEAFLVFANATYEVMFRQHNVLGQVKTYSMYGGSEDRTKDWASQLNAKILEARELQAVAAR